MPRFITCLLLIVSFFAGCSSGGESRLSKALNLAVKERKVTQRKVDSILAEYNTIWDDDKKRAQEYVTQILSAIEMGGDSSQIDAVRRQMLKSRPAKTKVL